MAQITEMVKITQIGDFENKKSLQNSDFENQSQNHYQLWILK